ncbi:retrovirus-related Pol polyprotein from transposon 297 [Trichonephila clavipes]|nr:retrovirus-related Pol polyprotein from transposon 297 [Trichonephila clavipes]
MRMDIELISDKPIKTKPYRMSPRQINILREEIKRLLELGVIEIGQSDYTSPFILVESPNKDPRSCVDYRRLNEITRAEFFPLPNMEEIVEKVSATSYVTVLDLSKGYFRIPLTPRAQRYAAFVTPFGTYIPKKMMFGTIASPLTDALKGKIKKEKITWDEKCGKAFEELKAKLVTQPILFAPDFATDFILQTDASEVGARVVLSQRIEGEEHPIVFLSKKFSKTERNYSTVERELAAISFGLKRLKHYLDGQKFIIETDHNPLRKRCEARSAITPDIKLVASGMSITEYLSLIGTYLLIRILELRAELMGLHKLNLKDLNKWAETILLERRQTKSVGRWDSRSTFLRSDWPRPFTRRE